MPWSSLDGLELGSACLSCELPPPPLLQSRFDLFPPPGPVKRARGQAAPGTPHKPGIFHLCYSRWSPKPKQDASSACVCATWAREMSRRVMHRAGGLKLMWHAVSGGLPAARSCCVSAAARGFWPGLSHGTSRAVLPCRACRAVPCAGQCGVWPLPRGASGVRSTRASWPQGKGRRGRRWTGRVLLARVAPLRSRSGWLALLWGLSCYRCMSKT